MGRQGTRRWNEQARRRYCQGDIRGDNIANKCRHGAWNGRKEAAQLLSTNCELKYHTADKVLLSTEARSSTYVFDKAELQEHPATIEVQLWAIAAEHASIFGGTAAGDERIRNVKYPDEKSQTIYSRKDTRVEGSHQEAIEGTSQNNTVGFQFSPDEVQDVHDVERPDQDQACIPRIKEYQSGQVSRWQDQSANKEDQNGQLLNQCRK